MGIHSSNQGGHYLQDGVEVLIEHGVAAAGAHDWWSVGIDPGLLDRIQLVLGLEDETIDRFFGWQPLTSTDAYCR